MPILNTVGDHIKKQRLELSLRQLDVACMIGTDKTTIYNWERNRSTPALRYLPKVIAFLGYNPITGDPRTLAEKALQYRKSRGMSQKELAKQIGIDPTTLSRFERNKGRCFQCVFRKINSFLQAHR